MEIFALILAIIFYSSLLVSLGIYFYTFIKKKYSITNIVMPTIFLQSLVVLMALSWIIILMNGGFNVNFYINVDFTAISFTLAPILVLLVVLDIRLQKKMDNLKGYKRTFRYILPILTVFIIFLVTIVFYFNINYFIYLNM